MFLERTPKEIVTLFMGKDFILPKQIYSDENIRSSCGKLPLRGNTEGLNIRGVGDHSYGRSENGSVVVDGFKADVVTKLMLGPSKIDPEKVQESQKKTMEFFKECSPPTYQVIAEVDGQAKTVIIQKKN